MTTGTTAMTDMTVRAFQRRFYFPDDAPGAPDPQGPVGMTYDLLADAEVAGLTRDQLLEAIRRGGSVMRDETGALWVFDSAAMAMCEVPVEGGHLAEGRTR